MKRLPTTAYQPALRHKPVTLTDMLRSYAGITFLAVSAVGIVVAVLAS